MAVYIVTQVKKEKEVGEEGKEMDKDKRRAGTDAIQRRILSLSGARQSFQEKKNS